MQISEWNATKQQRTVALFEAECPKDLICDLLDTKLIVVEQSIRRDAERRAKNVVAQECPPASGDEQGEVAVSAPQASPAPIKVVIDFDEEEIEGPNGKSIVVGRHLLELVDTLKGGDRWHFSQVQTETGIPSKKVKTHAETYRGQLSRIGLNIVIEGDFVRLIDLTSEIQA